MKWLNRMTTHPSPAASDAGRFLCRLDDIEDGGARAAEVDVGELWDLVLLRKGDRVFAYHNVCTHAGRNLDYAPGQFLLDKGRIVCPVHGSAFDIESGKCCVGLAAGPLKSVPVRILDGAVYLDSRESE